MNKKRTLQGLPIKSIKAAAKAQAHLRETDPNAARAAIATCFKRSGAERLWRHAAAEGRRRQARRDAR